MLNLQLFRTSFAIVRPVLAITSLRDVLPALAEVERLVIGDIDNDTMLSVVQLFPERFFFVELQCLVAINASSDSRLMEHRDSNGILGIQRDGFLGHDFRFGITFLVHQVVEFVDHLRKFLLDPDPVIQILFQDALRFFVTLLQVEIRLLTNDFTLQARSSPGQLSHQ